MLKFDDAVNTEVAGVAMESAADLQKADSCRKDHSNRFLSWKSLKYIFKNNTHKGRAEILKFSDYRAHTRGLLLFRNPALELAFLDSYARLCKHDAFQGYFVLLIVAILSFIKHFLVLLYEGQVCAFEINNDFCIYLSGAEGAGWLGKEDLSSLTAIFYACFKYDPFG